MSKLKLIEQALLHLEGGKFQNLCNEYLAREGFASLCSFGGVAGNEKTKTGTPDTYIERTNGDFIFVEYTTEQSGVCSKFKKDIQKCFDEKKTGIPIERIMSIILCYNSKLSPKERKELRDICFEKKCDLSHIDLDTLALSLLQKYPIIAREYLGIEIDTGQVLSPNDFIRQRTAFSVSLDNPFMFREDEINSLNGALDNQDLIVITGKPGLGKTKLWYYVKKKYNLNVEFSPINIL